MPDSNRQAASGDPDKWVPRLLLDVMDALWAAGQIEKAADLENVLEKHWPDHAREQRDGFADAAMVSPRH